MAKIINVKWVLPFMGVWLGCMSMASGQVKGGEKVVIPSSATLRIKGKFYPLFWKVKVNGSKSFIPLEHVDSFGIQRYRVNDHLVTEFTVALKSKTFIRFYHLKQEGLESKIQDIARNRANKNEYVIKDYPVTTHKEMMEYRVASKKDVDRLMEDFYETYLDYKMKAYVKEQREKSVKELDLDAEEEEEEEEKTAEEKALEALNDEVLK